MVPALKNGDCHEPSAPPAILILGTWTMEGGSAAAFHSFVDAGEQMK
jgi:hypothetical protein